MSKTQTKTVTWPYAEKTVGIGGMPGSYTVPYDYAPPPTYVTTHAEMGFQIFPPLYIYKPIGIYMHLNYTFNSAIATADQVLLGIYMRDTPSSYISAFGSSIEKFMPLNVQADSNRNINVSYDLTSIMTGRASNVVFLKFNSNCAASVRGYTGDTINIWKLDLTYQTIGIRDEK